MGENMRWRICALSLGSILALSIPFKAGRAHKARNRSGRAAPMPSLASYVPRQDLLLYLEFRGLDAHAGAWQKTAACRLLSETKLGTLLEDMAIQAIEVYQETVADQDSNQGRRCH